MPGSDDEAVGLVNAYLERARNDDRVALPD